MKKFARIAIGYCFMAVSLSYLRRSMAWRKLHENEVETVNPSHGKITGKGFFFCDVANFLEEKRGSIKKKFLLQVDIAKLAFFSNRKFE